MVDTFCGQATQLRYQHFAKAACGSPPDRSSTVRSVSAPLRKERGVFSQRKPPETLISQRFRGSHPHRGDKIRTCGLRVPNAALYQTEPRLDLYLLLRTNRSKQMLSYLIFTEASSPVLRFYWFYCFSVCRTVLFGIASRRSVFCLITNAITPEST